MRRGRDLVGSFPPMLGDSHRGARPDDFDHGLHSEPGHALKKARGLEAAGAMSAGVSALGIGGCVCGDRSEVAVLAAEGSGVS